MGTSKFIDRCITLADGSTVVDEHVEYHFAGLIVSKGDCRYLAMIMMYCESDKRRVHDISVASFWASADHRRTFYMSRLRIFPCVAVRLPAARGTGLPMHAFHAQIYWIFDTIRTRSPRRKVPVSSTMILWARM